MSDLTFHLSSRNNAIQPSPAYIACGDTAKIVVTSDSAVVFSVQNTVEMSSSAARKSKLANASVNSTILSNSDDHSVIFNMPEASQGPYDFTLTATSAGVSRDLRVVSA